MRKRKDLAQTGKRRSSGKRLLSFVLSICMALAMMPAMSITANAAPTNYDIWVGGVRVTSDNCNNITGAGISSGTVSYDPGTNTLTLDGAEITGAFSMGAGGLNAYVGISTFQELTIELRGDCSITPPPIATNSCGIYSGGLSNRPLTLSGDGRLLARGADVTANGAFSYGIYSTGTVTVSGPAVTAAGGISATRGSSGIYISGSDLIVSGGAVTATGDNASSTSYGIYAGALSISGATTVTATGGTAGSDYSSYGIFAANADSSISGGTVTATGGNAGLQSYGIYTSAKTLFITGGTVTAKTNATSSTPTRAAMDKAPDISGYTGAVTLTGASASPAQVVAAYTNEKYAKFGVMTTYSVTYDENGGGGTMPGGTAAAITAFPLPANAFTPPAGMAFDKWAVGSTAGAQVAANGSHTFTGDTTVYALWKLPAPSQPDMIGGSDSGASSTDNITNDSTPTFTGTAQSGNTITLLSDGSTIGTGSADGSGNWSITASPLADGDHTITAIASASGISSTTSSGLSIKIDTAAPSGYSVSIDQAAINNANKTAMSFTFGGAEASARYQYTVSSSGGGTAVNGSGTIVNANDRITGIDLSGLGDGTVTLSATLKDVAGNTGTAATDTASKDTAGPTVSSLSPANNVTGTSINADMVITFNEAVTAVAGKNIIIKTVSGDSTVETIDAADSKVTGSGTATITVNPTVSLANSTGYYIQIEAGAFKNSRNNEYAGIADTTSWRFTTADAPAVYTISAGAASFQFGSLTTGYNSAPAAQTVTVTNTGNQTITLTEPSTTNSSSNYIIGLLSRTTLNASETATFTVQPKIGLTVGTYNETINITGSNSAATSVLAQFSVAPSGGGGGGGGSSTPNIVTKIKSGENMTGTNLDNLVKEGKSLTVEGKAGEKLVFDAEALKNIDGQTKDNVKVEIKDVSADHKSEHPGRLVVSLTISAGGKHITSFGNGTATVSLHYELKAGEKAEDVTVWYLAEDGTMSEVPCSYNPVTKLATFKVNHFSLYVVGTVDTSKWANPYSDVKESSWYYDAVRYVSANGLMQGTKDTAFNPNAKTTRGMIVTILWRMENEPKAEKEITFTDVKNRKYYHDAVAWASDKGIVGGYSADRFGPEDNITREQLAVILHNYAASKGYKSGTAADLSAFSDAGKIHKWGKDALSWANAEGLINGTGSNLLNPLGAAERCQVAAILQRFMENMAK